ncbi:MAG: type II secretion system F family protein [Oscillospiraceae bacterium]|jgi:type IV pilus assembly protein PilC|nr:type II secretion system F family protein [Oscillospiraceae bacterium]
MPTYKYEAAYASGERVSGVVEAASEHEAVAQIRQTCEVVLSLKVIPAQGANPLDRFQKIDAKSLALTCQQFAIILKAGLPLVQTVDLAAGQSSDKLLRSILRQVSEDIANGWSLSYSLEQRGSRLPVTFRETIRAGEESGDLLSAFQRMAVYYDRTAKTHAKTVSTLTYPAFVMVVAVVVVGIIMGYAVPAFTNTFDSLGLELPWITEALIGVSSFFNKYFLVILAALAGVILALWAYSRTEQGGLQMSRLRLGLPIVGEIGRMAGASQFAHTMSAMLSAGMPILQAIETSGRAVSSRCMAREVLDTVSGVESGRSLGDSMAGARELPPMLVEMTAVGESAGALESTLEVLAEYYDNEVDVRTQRALALLEPAIICVLAVVVVFILMAVYLPMFNMYSAI